MGGELEWDILFKKNLDMSGNRTRVSDEDPLRSAKFSMTLTIAPQLPLRQGYLKLGINTVTIN